MKPIPFNKPFTIENEFAYMQDAINRGVLRGDGYYTHRVHELMEKKLGCKKFLLVHSGTAALEMAALLCDIQPGDEIIMPSYTFVSTANAFVLRGGVPVFIDIREDTLNIDEKLIEAAITRRRKLSAASIMQAFHARWMRSWISPGATTFTSSKMPHRVLAASTRGASLGR